LNKKFWNWVETEVGRTLYLDGAIAEETWYGDEITPKQFKSELMSGKEISLYG
jgi:ATP-dependent Clp protease protease subunit